MITMDAILNFCFLSFLTVVNCYSDSESAESNRIEVTPYYDTIIYSDVADIINEFEKDGMSPFDILTHSESQSEEKVEDLLTEYQHYLEKAHKQRMNYLEKTKTKNKVPLIRHEQFTKTKPGISLKHNEFYSNDFYNPSYKFQQSSLNNPLDVFIPLNSKGKYITKLESTTNIPKKNLFPFDKIIFNDKKLMDFAPVIRKSRFEPIKPGCFCKSGHMPCDCNCKQCFVHVDSLTRDQQVKLHLPQEQNSNSLHTAVADNTLKKYDQYITAADDLNENTLNIRIKIDLQLPKQQENFLGRYYKTHNHDKPLEPENVISKELATAVKLPSPYFDLPVPTELFDYKKSPKINSEDSVPIHKITIHKKKKSKTNNSNKRHRKKFITFHNIKLEQQPLFPIHFDENFSFKNSSTDKNSFFNITTTAPEIINLLNKTEDILTETQTDENLYSMVNISNNISSTTDDSHKYGNSVETDSTNMLTNMTTKVPIKREKRDVSSVNTTSSQDILLNISSQFIKSNNTNDKNAGKKAEKILITDDEFLYWPSVVRKDKFIPKKNITTIILENEHKKNKLNISKETIRLNHTRALEQAIFGDVDWDDIDTVAPAFMSFVGKYVRGILTFCSEKVCHSMKCANKTCLHRVCVPADRLNNKGHCAGSNSTDSVASMESIMDLPSNVAFEVVDILQNKMLGKIFGKATFCINSKCITLVASKKTFVKYRCTIKDLNPTGHCLNGKSVKLM